METEEVPKYEFVDSHFHYDRMIDGRNWSWSTKPEKVIDHQYSGHILKYAVTSFCDPEHYPTTEKFHSKILGRIHTSNYATAYFISKAKVYQYN